MAFFNFSRSKAGHKQFVNESEFIRNLNQQIEWSSQTLTALRKIDITEAKKLKIEYFFYTNDLEKATLLANSLKELNYEVEYGRSAGENKDLIVTGWTT